jgi:hypothetical protein
MLGEASLNFPTEVGFARWVPPPDVKKEHLPFHMSGDGSPTLLITMNGLKGNAKKYGNLLLGLIQGPA